MMPQLLNNRYRIIQALGSGGFGKTFLAEDTQMPSSRRCVIKQLKPITTNPQIYQLVKQRFQREAAVLEELGDRHSQIPKLYAYFEVSEEFYLVQEFIEGETLTNLVRSHGTLNEIRVQEILASLLSVLDYVHSQRIVHRDIKPDNIILRQRDRLPVLIDFGAVRETMATVVNSSSNNVSSIVIGTPGFMPSEQAAGRPLYSSDLYSLGLTAIYLLTGRMPPELDTDRETGEIIWRQYALNVSQQFADLLDKAIQSHPRDRYPSAKEMLNALQPGNLQQVQPILPTTLPPTMPPVDASPSIPTITSPATTQNKRKPLIVGIFIILLGLFVGIFQFIFLPFLRQLNSTIPVTQTPVTTTRSPTTIPNIIESSTPANIIADKSPQQEIYDYYANINQGKYQTAWRQQSPKLQSNKDINPRGYDDYLKFWQTVERVDLQDVRIIAKTDTTAILDVRLNYIKNGGKLDPYYWRYYLVWDTEEKRWLLDDRKRLNS